MDRAFIQLPLNWSGQQVSSWMALRASVLRRAVSQSVSALRRGCSLPSACWMFSQQHKCQIASGLRINAVNQRHERQLTACTAPKAPCRSSRLLQRRLQGSPRDGFSHTPKSKPSRLSKLSVLAVPACARSHQLVQCVHAAPATRRALMANTRVNRTRLRLAGYPQR